MSSDKFNEQKICCKSAATDDIQTFLMSHKKAAFSRFIVTITRTNKTLPHKDKEVH